MNCVWHEIYGCKTMRFSITNLFGRDRDSAAIFLAVNASLGNRPPELKSLLETFLDQSAAIRSIVAVGCHELLGITGKNLDNVSLADNGNRAAVIPLIADKDSGKTNIAGESIRSVRESPGAGFAWALESLARQARELSGLASGDDLLLLPADLLSEMITPPADDFSFRAVAALLPQRAADGNGWRLRRALFDRGLICIGSVPVAGTKALCFLASDAVRCLRNLDVESRGHIAMSVLTEYGLFGNQLFRYACVKLYALRHGLTPAFPEWQGQQLYGLEDKSCAGLTFPKLNYPAFADNDREFWYADDPPIDIDLDGYFQEIPECWQKHRALLVDEPSKSYGRLFTASETMSSVYSHKVHTGEARAKKCLTSVVVVREWPSHTSNHLSRAALQIAESAFPVN